jgi:ubiquinone biosynthesis protein
MAVHWSWSYKAEEKRTRFGQLLAESCERLGPSFVKVAQFLSTRPDLLTAEVLLPLSRLQDRVRPMPRRHFRKWVTLALGQPIESVFSEFPDEPIASGSVAEVYRAQRRDTGEWVAVKLQRRRIRRIVAADLEILRAFIKIMKQFPAFRDLPLLEAVGHAGACLEQQLDFDAERRINLELCELFAGGALIRIPKIDESLSGRDIIVMEFIDGLVRLDDRALDDHDFRRAAEILLHAIYRMIFVGGVVHCDLHPANVYTTSGGELVILDTGLAARLSPEERNDFAELFRALAFSEADRCVEVLRRIALRVPAGFDPQKFGEDVRAVIERASSATAGDFSVGRFAYALFECQRRHGLIGIPDFMMAIWALLMVEGILKARWPDLDFQRKAVPYLTGVLVRSLAT